jgi:cadmium resistance protein CadD (predicted permease)
MWSWEVMTVGVAAFVSTNLDDLVLLALWFSLTGSRVVPIVTGQCLGIGALVLASLAGAFMALAIPPRWIPLIGVVPIALGIKYLVARDEDDNSGEPSSGIGVLAVAGVTIANGADNIAVYIPLFASRPRAWPAYVTIFALCTLAWCALGRALVAQPLVGAALQRYGHRIMPWVLIAIGVHVLADALPGMNGHQ